MSAARGVKAALAMLVATSGAAADADDGWEFGLTAYPTVVRGGDNYVTGIALADRGPLHLEARVNYESVGSRSAFVGWTFSGGEALTWELTPLLGGAWGDTQAFVPGFEASLAWQRIDFYVEAEYVRRSGARTDSYTYAWTELGGQPLKWLRLGLAGQRTRAYDNQRDIQRGPFVQFTWQRLRIGGYWFNPGSSAQVFVGSIGASF